jgi:hypothetical protein
MANYQTAPENDVEMQILRVLSDKGIKTMSTITFGLAHVILGSGRK